MNRWILSVAVVAVRYAVLFGVGASGGEPAPSMKVGFAETDITPALGMEQPGGYETRLTSSSNLEPSAARKMVEAALDLAKRMKPGKTPEPPSAAPFSGAEWSYGSVPPELNRVLSLETFGPMGGGGSVGSEASH